MKTCSMCRATKPVERFSADRRASDGLQSYCRDCDNAKSREYRARNREARAAYFAAYRAANAEKVSLSKKRWYARPENRERVATNGKNLRGRTDPAVRRATKAEYRARRPEVHREHGHRRRAKLKGAFVEAIDIAVLAARDGGVCQICGGRVPEELWSIDHIIPIAHGGEHSYRNTRLTHRSCNVRRVDRGPAQIRLMS